MDICGPAPKGTGLQNLRECIIGGHIQCSPLLILSIS
jgi:hypothetical protein